MADSRIDELRRRLERDPGSRLFAQLAEELRKGGDLAEAVRVARAGLAVHPAYPSARLTLGRALLDSGDAEGARGELESALRDAPDNIQASRFLAQAREKLGDMKGAAEQYRRTLQMAPGDRQLETALAGVEARLAAPAGGAGAVASETRPPQPPQAAPRAPAPPAPPSGAAPAPRAPAPPRPPGEAVVFAPSRPSAPHAPESEAEESPGVLPPTLRIHAPQLPAEPPAEPATLPGGRSPMAASPEQVRAAATDAVPALVASPVAPPKAPPPPVPPPPPPPPPPALPPQPVAAEPRPEPRAAERQPEPVASAPLASSTLAELYFQQGLVDRARDVYRQLLEQEPANQKARERLAALEAAAPEAVDPALRRRALERTIAGLESMLAAVRRR